MLIEAARSGSPAVLRLILDYPNSLAQPQVQQLPPPQLPPIMGQQPQQQGHSPATTTLQNGGASGVMMPPLSAPSSAVDVLHQHAATAAAVAMHTQHQRSGLAVRQAFSNHPQHHPQLKEALANAYAAGWADGAASRAQQSPLAMQQPHLLSPQQQAAIAHSAAAGRFTVFFCWVC